MKCFVVDRPVGLAFASRLPVNTQHNPRHTMASIWANLSKRYPEAFNNSTLPVWLTLFPVIGGGCVWAGYVSARTLFGHNEIVLASSATEPYLTREAPKLMGRNRNIATKERYNREMDGQ